LKRRTYDKGDRLLEPGALPQSVLSSAAASCRFRAAIVISTLKFSGSGPATITARSAF